MCLSWNLTALQIVPFLDNKILGFTDIQDLAQKFILALDPIVWS